MAETGTNPYLALLQQQQEPPGWAQILQHIGNLGFGLAGGFGQAAATGQPTMNAIGPGLMMGNQLNAQAAQQAEQERMKRLEWQFKAQEHEDKRAEMLRNQAAIDAYVKNPGFQVEPQQGPLMGPGGASTGTPDQNAIGGIESGGRYDAIGPAANNKGQRAYGKYQIMDFNIGPWTQEVLGKPMTPQEFLANPQAQDAVFNAKFGQYSQKYGPVGASRAWFAGEGGMNNPNAADVNGMTVQRYGDRFAQSRGVASAPVGPPPVGPGGAGPMLSALPAFEGPGAGTIQPGALPEGVQPSVNLPTPAPVPPPQVAQGDAVTPGGSPVNPNAPPPQFMQPGGPNVVQAQYAPTPGTPPMSPPPRLRALPPELEARINSLVGLPRGVGLTIAQAEKMKEDARAAQYQGDLKAWEVGQQAATEQRKIEAQKATEQRKLETELVPMRDRTTGEVKAVSKAEALRGAQSGQLVPLEASKEAREEAAAALARAQAKVNPDGTPNQPLIQAETQQAAATTAAQEAAKLDTTAATALVTNAVKEFVDKERPKGLAVQETIPNIHNVRRLVDAGAITGTGTETRNYLSQLASTLGFQSKEAALTPAYLGAMADQIVANAKALGVNPTNRDNEIIAKAKGADPNVSKEGVLQLLDIQEQLQRRAHQRYTAEAKRVSGMRGVKQAYGDDYFMLPEPPKYEDWLKDNPLPTPQGQPGASAAPAAPQGGLAPPEPGTVRKGFRFKGGDPNQRMNWEPVK